MKSKIMTQKEYNLIMNLSMSFHKLEENKYEISDDVDKFWEQLTDFLNEPIIVKENDKRRLSED
jgi:hypothetical protein